jgi:translation initiation factor IF-3
MDFGKYIYEQQKKAKDSKTSSAKLKEVKFRPRVETHDYLTKLRHAEMFLFHGNKVKLTLSFRGREMAHTAIGFETIKRAVNDLGHIAHPDNEGRLMGRNIIVMMSPLPANKRKLKFNEEGSKEMPPEQDHEDEHEDEQEDSKPSEQ